MSENADSIATAIGMSNKLSFVTDPRFCARHLSNCQANLLAFKEKISDLSLILTILMMKMGC